MDPKIVSFPKSALPKKPKTDADHVTAVRKAWKALQRTIAAAENSGLRVEFQAFGLHGLPEITRRWR